MGDGRYSSGSPVPAPSGPGPEVGALVGRRVWVYRGGQWTDRVLRGWRQGHAYVAPLHAWEGEVQPTVARYIAPEMPRDCGALVPPQAVPGIGWWLTRDPTIFANMPGIGDSVPRDPILWESVPEDRVG